MCFVLYLLPQLGEPQRKHRLFFFLYVIRLEINYFYADIWVVVPRLLPAWDETAPGWGGCDSSKPGNGDPWVPRDPPQLQGGTRKDGW